VPPAHADVYTWVDRAGLVNVSNLPPRRFGPGGHPELPPRVHPGQRPLHATATVPRG
jgi:hypothetical protein